MVHPSPNESDRAHLPWASLGQLTPSGNVGLVAAAVVFALMTAGGSTVQTGVLTEPQTAQPGEISGRIVDSATMEPIAAANVMLLTSPLPQGGPLRQSARDDGTFHFQSVPPGRYALHVTARGYLPGGSGKNSPWDLSVAFDVAVGQRLTDVIIRVWPSGAIAGTVRDERGEPLVLVPVRPLKLDYVAGEPVWVDVGLSAQRLVTDDRGAYRFGGLEPADYIMMAPAPAGTSGPSPIHELAYQAGFSGGAWSIREAMVIPLGPGEQREGVDISVRVGAVGQETGRFPLSGRLAPGTLHGRAVPVHLLPIEASVTSSSVQGLVSTADSTGRFSFPAVPAGRYHLQAWRLPDTSTVESLVADLPIEVKGPVADLAVKMRPGSSITGRLLFDGDGPLPTAQQIAQVTVSPGAVLGRNLARIPERRVASDGRFATIGLPPGKYVLAVNTNALPGWHQEQLTSGGRILVGKAIDLGSSDLDVTVTLTNRLTRITGVVRDTAGRTRPDARVIVFSRDPEKRGYGLANAPTCVARTAPTSDGTFGVSVMPSCDPLVVAVAGLPRLWMAPSYLESLVPLATPANVVPDETRTIDLVARP